MWEELPSAEGLVHKDCCKSAEHSGGSPPLCVKPVRYSGGSDLFADVRPDERASHAYQFD